MSTAADRVRSFKLCIRAGLSVKIIAMRKATSPKENNSQEGKARLKERWALFHLAEIPTEDNSRDSALRKNLETLSNAFWEHSDALDASGLQRCF